MPDDIIETREFPAGDRRGESPYLDTGGVPVTPRFLAFVQQALTGKLPDLGTTGELDPEIIALAEELAVVHLPEWRNPAGRKLAAPTVTSVRQAPRIAEYLYQRGWRHHRDLEQIRWIPTPGGPAGPHDTGLHITPDEHGQWPAPDPEQFWDIAEIEVNRLADGTWAASHPRGIAFEAATKSEAYAGLAQRIRNKIEEANNGMDW